MRKLDVVTITGKLFSRTCFSALFYFAEISFLEGKEWLGAVCESGLRIFGCRSLRTRNWAAKISGIFIDFFGIVSTFYFCLVVFHIEKGISCARKCCCGLFFARLTWRLLVVSNFLKSEKCISVKPWPPPPMLFLNTSISLIKRWLNISLTSCYCANNSFC